MTTPAVRQHGARRAAHPTGKTPSSGRAAQARKRLTAGSAATDWIVILQFRRPDSGSYRLHPSVYPAITNRVTDLGGLVPALRVCKDHLFVSYQATAGDLLNAADSSQTVILELCALLNISSTDAVEARVLTRDQVERLARGDEGGFVGVAEAAAILGVSKQRVHQLTEQPDFPTPVQELKATPIWRESDVQAYALARASRPRVASASSSKPARARAVGGR
jgi:predicted DNA-binding transcriptional regulator AlpA